jgi:ABC-type Mn2+/Zn2+ transport system ATPase subunit
MSIRDNITLASLRCVSTLGFLSTSTEERKTADLIQQLNIVARSSEQLVATLSGGNQQKCVLGKWLSTAPRLLMLDEPTRGIDVGAKAQIHKLIDRIADTGEPVWAHAFEYACAQNAIDHRLTKPKHPWTNGQVERMNRTIKDATVNRYFYETHDELRAHLRDFVDAYNFARRLKTLKGLTPYEFICKARTSQPQRFTISPLQQTPGLNI